MTREQIARALWLTDAEPHHETLRVSMWESSDPNMRATRRAYLTKADRILAALSAPPQQGERERALEALYEAVKARSWECPGGVATAYQRVRDLTPPVKEETDG
jgi:hypothetical protein